MKFGSTMLLQCPSCEDYFERCKILVQLDIPSRVTMHKYISVTSQCAPDMNGLRTVTWGQITELCMRYRSACDCNPLNNGWDEWCTMHPHKACCISILISFVQTPPCYCVHRFGTGGSNFISDPTYMNITCMHCVGGLECLYKFIKSYFERCVS